MPTTGACECARATSPHPRAWPSPAPSSSPSSGCRRWPSPTTRPRPSRRCWRLRHGHAWAFLHHLPAYGGSLILRAPFALLPAAWHGGDLALFRTDGRPLPAGRRRARRRAAPPRPRPRRRAHRGAGRRSCSWPPTRSRCAPWRSVTPRSSSAARCASAPGSPRSPAARCWPARCSAPAMANKPWAVVAVAPVLLDAPRRAPPRPGLRGRRRRPARRPDAPAQRRRADEHRRHRPHQRGDLPALAAVVVPRRARPPRRGPRTASTAAIARRRRGSRASAIRSWSLVPVAVALLVGRRRRVARRPREGLALLALALQLRGLLDTWNTVYYALPACLALVGVGGPRPPPAAGGAGDHGADAGSPFELLPDVGQPRSAGRLLPGVERPAGLRARAGASCAPRAAAPTR